MKAARFTSFNAAALAAGLVFLHGPILLVVLFSFNASRLVTVWGGFSTRWYAALAGNAPLLEAAWTSLRVAVGSATLATTLGTLAALALVRHGRFRGRVFFTGALYLPLVLPDVITGLSLLLLFVALGVERGFWTVMLAHATATLPVATLVVQARLVALDPSLEEAASDLGAGPLRVFGTVTLPLVGPAVAGAFLLAFTLSLDDLVVASFAAGPGSTTLPMFVFSQVRRGVTPEINAIASLLILLVTFVLSAAALLSGRRRVLTGRDAAQDRWPTDRPGAAGRP